MSNYSRWSNVEACQRCGEVLDKKVGLLQHECETFIWSSDDEEISPNGTQKCNKKQQQPHGQRNITKLMGKRQSTPQLSDEDGELLIAAVQRYRPLWDFTLPVEKRDAKSINKLWQQVSNDIAGILDAEQCKARFKGYRDSYRRIIQNEALPSGSAAPSTSSKWKYYNIMEFLRDSCLITKTASNLMEDKENKINEIDEISNPAPKRRKVDAGSEAIKKLVNVVCSRPRLEFPTEAPKSDEIDSVLTYVGYQIRKMPANIQQQYIEFIIQQAHALNVPQSQSEETASS